MHQFKLVDSNSNWSWNGIIATTEIYYVKSYHILKQSKFEVEIYELYRKFRGFSIFILIYNASVRVKRRNMRMQQVSK